ncbi:MAG: 30S ribosomal protein S12 methylthiotransferase RimO [Nitrospinota bacterium]|nr:MAG: 30S ribosomal protein S12 methylthiotransferase RimO [Nitrospinota bacterium]
MPKVGLVSLGCQKNRVDSEVMLGLLQQAGCQITTDAAEAEVIIVHSCAFIEAAKEESIDTILEMGELKKQGNCRKLIVSGCLSERYREELSREIPEIDVLIGTGDLQRIVDICQSLVLEHHHDPFYRRQEKREKTRPQMWFQQKGFLYDADTPRLRTTPSHTAYVKIAEGCDYRCTFCIIPHLRGRQQSRTRESIVQEVRALAAQGVKEVNLIAQTINTYGRDRYGRPQLVSLLEDLASIQGICWIRLLYNYPTDVTPELITLMAQEPKICPYFDLPLQHCNDTLLKAMNRKGRRKDIERLLHTIRETLPEAIIRTTFIVGFPGERERDFQELLRFVETVQFDRVGVFTYSREEGTPAALMKSQVPQAVKERRRHRLMEVQRAISRRKNEALVGTIQEVLIDGPSPDLEYVMEGRTRGQAPEIDGVVYIEGEQPSPGQLVPVRITRALDYDLIGEVVPQRGASQITVSG